MRYSLAMKRGACRRLYVFICRADCESSCSSLALYTFLCVFELSSSPRPRIIFASICSNIIDPSSLHIPRFVPRPPTFNCATSLSSFQVHCGESKSTHHPPHQLLSIYHLCSTNSAEHQSSVFPSHWHNNSDSVFSYR